LSISAKQKYYARPIKKPAGESREIISTGSASHGFGEEDFEEEEVSGDREDDDENTVED
jgi:hypothetical protein